MESTTGLSNTTPPFIGFCLDDGTGRNIYYVNSLDNSMQRTCPPNYVPSLFENGDRVYYFRGSCIRCRQKVFPSVLTKNKMCEAYSLNICHNCLLSTVLNITTLKGNGDLVWAEHGDVPKNMYVNLKSLSSDSNRDKNLNDRAKTARIHVMTLSKRRRDLERWSTAKDTAAGYQVLFGTYVSWGYGKVYDEYFGEVDSKNRPHGKGVKMYSDGSIYAGGWFEGEKSTSYLGILSRPNGYEYEGSFMQDMRHGSGSVRYPDGSTYRGEFARDLEHGHGTLQYADGSHFEGRFRFGKRDGMGTLVHLNGTVEKDTFHDVRIHYLEKPIPKIVENEDEGTGLLDFSQPDSLMTISRSALATTMITKRHLVSSQIMQDKLPDYLKEYVARFYLRKRHPVATEVFENVMAPQAFLPRNEIVVDSIRLNTADMETIVYFQGANTALQKLRLIANKLESASIEVLCRHIARNVWKDLSQVDLSFNRLEMTSLRTIMQAISGVPTLHSLRLAGCKIGQNGAHAIASLLENNEYLTHLDLSFNTVKAAGAEIIAESLLNNVSLVSINLRQNDIGVLGGSAFANLLRYNCTLKQCCLVDNGIGTENSVLISARMSGTMTCVMESVRAKELVMPERYIAEEDKEMLKK